MAKIIKKDEKYKILIKKGDTVAVIAGKDRGKTGKVMKVLPKENRLIVENLNLRKRHVRPKRQGQKGQTVETAAPIHTSNVQILCKNCGSKTRIGKKILEDKTKIRICKKCGGEL